MATTPEGRVKAAIKAYLKAKGAYWSMPIGTGFGSSGVPDFLICYRGNFVAIEAKAPGKRHCTTAAQKRNLVEIISNGGRAVVVDDASQLDEIFATL